MIPFWTQGLSYFYMHYQSLPTDSLCSLDMLIAPPLTESLHKLTQHMASMKTMPEEK